MRSFSLNSREFYEAVCPPENRQWLATKPNWPGPSEGPLVSAESDEAVQSAFREWQADLDARRIGG